MRHQPEMTDRSRSGRAIFFAPAQTPPERSAFAAEKQHFYDICNNSALSQMYVSNVQYVPEKEGRRPKPSERRVGHRCIGVVAPSGGIAST